MVSEHIPTEVILFSIIYGITFAVPLIAALYLLLRPGNAFAPGVTPPVRLRRWAAAFFAMSALGHVWWYLFYAYSRDLHSAAYVVVCVVDCVFLLITVAGTLLAMLQDRKRPIWPASAALIPIVVLGVLQIIYPEGSFMEIAGIYILSLYVLFTGYMMVAIRQYGRWLNDNYADLENKKVWLSQVLLLFFLLLLILYSLVNTDNILIFILHVIELVLFGLLLWRVETLPQLENTTMEPEFFEPAPEDSQPSALNSKPLNIPSNIEQLLDEHCVDTQLYLQHELTLNQLAQAIGTNRFYLSQYFSREGITYNTYINNLRINHFMTLFRKATDAGQSITAQQLAHDSGYRSYSTFSLAFKHRTGQSVTAWMRQSAE